MCFYLCLIPSLSFPQLILVCCKILLFIMVLFHPSRDSRPLPPPVSKYRVACYVALGFCRKYSLLPTFITQTDDVMFLDIFTPEGFFDFSTPKFRIESVYSRSLTQPLTYTVSPATTLANHDFPDLVTGDFNIHNLVADPLRF